MEIDSSIPSSPPIPRKGEGGKKTLSLTRKIKKIKNKQDPPRRIERTAKKHTKSTTIQTK